MFYGIIAAVAALLLAAALSALLRPFALRRGLLDRRRRVRPVPLLGGVAVVVATVAIAGAGEWAGVARLDGGVGALLAGAVAVALLGLAADLWRLRTRFVLVGTAVAALCVMPYERTGVAGGVLAALWVAGAALAFRSLDHADAVVGTVGVVTAFGVAACAALEVRDGLAVLLSVLAAALTGFLMHNWPPARIALGATGSLFVGFLLAGAAIETRAGGEVTSSLAILFLLTAVAAADVLLVLLARRISGRPLLRTTPAPDHLSHRLRRTGLTRRGVAILLGTLASAAVLVGVLIHTGGTGAVGALWALGAVLVTVTVLLCVGGPELRSREGTRPAPTGAHGETWTEVGRGRGGAGTEVGRGRGGAGTEVGRGRAGIRTEVGSGRGGARSEVGKGRDGARTAVGSTRRGLRPDMGRVGPVGPVGPVGTVGPLGPVPFGTDSAPAAPVDAHPRTPGPASAVGPRARRGAVSPPVPAPVPQSDPTRTALVPAPSSGPRRKPGPRSLTGLIPSLRAATTARRRVPYPVPGRP
ncbi:undecaprenyl/decaprenyl-phosphate alpha-N-acetylglucosaminyl 1-phosphate transferase [Streptomyces sp. NPDC091377]|uniref:undecaprenyl/decaprenyl-phosphate alpha-N-acetylglucosaminyl 1-phosphate transferase n=1 Tax=Streptomyces sp. NPDC091377 TaxID=3365995 RepID=UPI003813C48F